MIKFIFFKILFMSAAFTLSGALVVLCEKAFSGVMSRRVLFRLWLVPLILSLVPIVMPVSVSFTEPYVEHLADLKAEYTQKTDENTAPQPVPEYQENVDAPAQSPIPIYVNAAAQPLLTDLPDEKPIDKKHIDIDLILILAYIYFACALFIIAAHIIGAIRFSKKFGRFAVPCEEDIPAELLERAGVKRRVGLFSAEGRFSPFVYGVFLPKIAVPDGNISPEALLHELIHIKRNDLLFLSVMNFVKAVHFFNPFTYVYSARMKKSMELSCDEEATSKMDNDERLLYSKNLISYSAPISRSVAYLSENGKYLKERIELVLKNKKRGRCAKIITVFIVLALVLFQAACAATINGLSPKSDHGDNRENEAVSKYVSRAEAVEIAREHAHAVYDSEYIWIDDSYYELRDENDTAYMIALFENISRDYELEYIIEKATGNILWRGGGYDYRDGKMDEVLSLISEEQEKDGSGYRPTLQLKPCNTYQDILDNTYTVLSVSDIWPDFITDDDLFSYSGIGEANLGRTVDEALDAIGYTFLDVDGNGIKELIIANTGESSWSHRILLMYTLHDNKPVRLIDGVFRGRYFLLNDGTIYYFGSGGATLHTIANYRIAEDGTGLESIDYYYSGYLSFPEFDPSEFYWFYNKTGEHTEDESEIIGDEVDVWAIDENYQMQIKELKLTFFSEYR